MLLIQTTVSTYFQMNDTKPVSTSISFVIEPSLSYKKAESENPALFTKVKDFMGTFFPEQASSLDVRRHHINHTWQRTSSDSHRK